MEARLNLQFRVNEQRLSADENWKYVAAESENYLKTKFIFESGPWETPGTVAVFTSPYGITYETPLDENGECFVPLEALAHPGRMAVSLYYSVIGQEEDEYDVIHDVTDFRITTNTVNVLIHSTLPVFHSGGEG